MIHEINTLCKLIKQLPDALQNIIFYYLTLHPVANIFQNKLMRMSKRFTIDYKKELIKVKNYKWYCNNTYIKRPNNMTFISLQDFKLYLMLEDILGYKRNRIYWYQQDDKICKKCIRYDFFCLDCNI